MKTTNRTYVIIWLITAFIVAPLLTIGVLYYIQTNKGGQTPTSTSRQEMKREDTVTNKALIEKISALDRQLFIDKSDNPRISIVSHKVIDNWHLVSVKFTDNSDNNLAKFLLLQSNTTDPIQVVLGPGTQFNEDDRLGKGIPESIIVELNNL